jgi:putative transcriptional regulator
LVAGTTMPDPNFKETVLLLLSHQEQASLALVLNRPTWVDAAETFPDAAALADYPGRLFRGGPVTPTQLLLLIEIAGEPPRSTQRIVGSIYLSTQPDILRELDLAGENPPRARLYAGYAVWGPGQLEEEIAAGNWRVIPSQPEHVFSDDPETLWRRLPVAADEVSAAVR